jgi:transcriptional regulator with XRE-family HTH domain
MRLTNVKLRRFERGLLQMEVAKHAAIACCRLAEIENGDAEPRPDELQRLALVLEVSTQYLLGIDSQRCD